MKEKQGNPEGWGSQTQKETQSETERLTGRMKGKGHSKRQAKGGRKRARQPSRKTPKIQNLPGCRAVLKGVCASQLPAARSSSEKVARVERPNCPAPSVTKTRRGPAPPPP